MADADPAILIVLLILFVIFLQSRSSSKKTGSLTRAGTGSGSAVTVTRAVTGMSSPPPPKRTGMSSSPPPIVVGFGGMSSSPPIAAGDDEETLAEKIEHAINELLEEAVPFLVGAAGGYALGETLNKLINAGDTLRDISRLLKITSERFTSFVASLKEIRVNFLGKVSFRFKLIYDTVKGLVSLETLIKLGMFIPNTIKSLGYTMKQFLDEAATSIAKIASMSGDDLARAALVIMEHGLVSTGEFAARTALQVLKGLTVVDVILIAVAITGAVLDAENVGHMQDWRQTKTSDFLSYKETMLRLHKDAIIEAKLPFPLIRGPLDTMDNSTYDDQVAETTYLLLYIPKPEPSITPSRNVVMQPDQLIIYSVFYRNTNHATDALAITDAESNPRMQQLRRIQNTLFTSLVRHYNTEKNGGKIPANPPFGFFQNMVQGNFLAPLLAGDRALLDELHDISIYYMCRSRGGNLLNDKQCSYRTASQCFASYPSWPIQDNTDNSNYVPPPNPGISGGMSTCPLSNGQSPTINNQTSPCLDISKDFGKTDHVYSEWRTVPIIKNDYGKDYTTPANSGFDAPTGACVVYPSAMRTYCNATTKLNTTQHTIGTNYYNRYTGTCINEKSYCDAFGISFTNSMPVSKMANRGTQPLPSCYQSKNDEVWSWILGGSSLVQYLNIAYESMYLGNPYFFGMKTDAGNAEEARIEKETQIAIQSSDPFQLSLYTNFLGFTVVEDDQDISLVDFRYDPFGDMYFLYAYGFDDPTLILMKCDKFFNCISSKTKTYPSNGIVTEMVKSRIAIDDYGNLYMLEYYYADEVLKQKITKRDPSGNYIQSQWTDIAPEASIEQLINPNGADPTIQLNFINQRFNGIFIRNDTLYVSYYGFDQHANENYLNILKYNLNDGGDPIGRMWTDKNPFLVQTSTISNAYSDPILQGLSSAFESLTGGMYTERTRTITTSSIGFDNILNTFIVNDNEEIFSEFLNLGVTGQDSQIWYVANKITKIVVNPDGASITMNNITIPLPSTNYPISPYIDKIDTHFYQNLGYHGSNVGNLNIKTRMFPKLCIDRFNRVYVSDGFKIYYVDSATPGYNGFREYTDDAYILNPAIPITPQIEAWEFNHLSLDNNDNLVSICNRNSMIIFDNVNLLGGDIYKNIKPSYPETIIRKITGSSVILGYDYIRVNNINKATSNCFGPERITYSISPAPLFQEANYFDIWGNIDKYTEILLDVPLPINTGKINFDRNTSYSIRLNIRGTSILEVSNLRMINPSNWSIQTGFSFLNATLNTIYFSDYTGVNSGTETRVLNVLINPSPNQGIIKTYTDSSSITIPDASKLVNNRNYTIYMGMPWTSFVSGQNQPLSAGPGGRTFSFYMNDLVGKRFVKAKSYGSFVFDFINTSNVYVTNTSSGHAFAKTKCFYEILGTANANGSCYLRIHNIPDSYVPVETPYICSGSGCNGQFVHVTTWDSLVYNPSSTGVGNVGGQAGAVTFPAAITAGVTGPYVGYSSPLTSHTLKFDKAP